MCIHTHMYTHINRHMYSHMSYICPDMYTLTCAHMHALCTHAHTCHVSHLIDVMITWLYWYHVVSFVLFFSSIPYLTLKFLFSLPEELSPLFSYWSLTTINPSVLISDACVLPPYPSSEGDTHVCYFPLLYWSLLEASCPCLPLLLLITASL